MTMLCHPANETGCCSPTSLYSVLSFKTQCSSAGSGLICCIFSRH